MLAYAIIVEPIRDPIDWMVDKYKELYNREPTEQELKDVVIEEGKPEKIKTVDIDTKEYRRSCRHSILSNAATRRADKAEHFSREA